MREILFRGKRTDNGKQVEGNLFIPDKDDAPTQICIGTNIIRITYDVIPETVGEYTGLTDKNGKKIFEGDILDCGDRVICVKWHDFCGTWDSVFIRYKGSRQSNGIAPVEWKYRAVIIGNIHDNPELIKGGAE